MGHPEVKCSVIVDVVNMAGVYTLFCNGKVLFVKDFVQIARFLAATVVLPGFPLVSPKFIYQ
jgi:hypothetical protein